MNKESPSTIKAYCPSCAAMREFIYSGHFEGYQGSKPFDMWNCSEGHSHSDKTIAEETAKEWKGDKEC